MNKLRTTGKRYLKDDIWHDDNGPLPDSPSNWDPPMTDAEITVAALSDPDCQPSTPEKLARMRRISRAKFIRQKMGLSQEQFAERFRIPLGTLRDWEQHRTEPDQAARAYLHVIEREPEAAARAFADAAE